MIVAASRLARVGSIVFVFALGTACTKNNTTTAESDPAAPAVQGALAAVNADEAEPAPKPTLPEAAGILSKAAEAMGGAEALANVKSFYYRGTIEMKAQNIRGDLEIWWKDGDFFMEQNVPGIGEIRAGKRGEEIWSEDPVNGPRKLSGVEAEQHAWASSLLLPAEWTRYFDTATTIAERKADGRTLYDVELSAKSGLSVTMSFDAESGLQFGQSFEQITPMGKQPFEVRFEDYREVEGIKLAFRQIIDAKVQQVVQEITKMEINAEVDETRFGFPYSGDVVKQPKAG